MHRLRYAAQILRGRSRGGPPYADPGEGAGVALVDAVEGQDKGILRSPPTRGGGHRPLPHLEKLRQVRLRLPAHAARLQNPVSPMPTRIRTSPAISRSIFSVPLMPVRCSWQSGRRAGRPAPCSRLVLPHHVRASRPKWSRCRQRGPPGWPTHGPPSTTRRSRCPGVPADTGPLYCLNCS